MIVQSVIGQSNILFTIKTAFESRKLQCNHNSSDNYVAKTQTLNKVINNKLENFLKFSRLFVLSKILGNCNIHY